MLSSGFIHSTLQSPSTSAESASQNRPAPLGAELKNIVGLGREERLVYTTTN